MEVSGKVKVVGGEQQVSPTFKKRELVVTTDEQYPQSIMIEFVQDKCDLLNNVTVGEEVKVSINLGGKKSSCCCFTTSDAAYASCRSFCTCSKLK
jgi:hypothetical protein